MAGMGTESRVVGRAGWVGLGRSPGSDMTGGAVVAGTGRGAVARFELLSGSDIGSVGSVAGSVGSPRPTVWIEFVCVWGGGEGRLL